MNEEYAAYEAWLAQQDADRHAGYAYGLAEENDRLRTQLAQCCAVVDAATALVEEWYPSTLIETELDSNERMYEALDAAVAALTGPVPDGTTEETP